jgi:DNA helicase-2/ATP-dependent DNA helicase PcrA
MPEFLPTPEQAAILGHDVHHHGRILAGPGTGKSATLVALVGQLLGREPQPRIRLLTFTRAATAELAHKASDHPAAAVERPSTIHSFAMSVLLQNPGTVNFPEPLRLVDEWENKALVRSTLARRVGVSVNQLKKLVQEMAANWESLVPHQDRAVSEQERARFLGGWNEHRRIFGYTLVAELPYALREVLVAHPDIRGVDYDLLVVDEYQDLNACDLDVLLRIAGKGCRVLAAGDDDQSIYDFRKAAPEGIRRFLDTYPDCSDYQLSVTQRCARRIVTWANFVIAQDVDRPQGRPLLRTADGAPLGDTALLSFRGEAAEARGIAALVERLVTREGIAPPDILILLRSDHNGTFGRPIREALGTIGIACSDPEAALAVLEHPANRQLLAMMRLVVNAEDSLSWATLLRLATGIGESFLDYIYDRAQRRPDTTFGRALVDAYHAGFPGGPSPSSKRARDLVEEVQAWLAGHLLPDGPPEGGWCQWITQVAGQHPAPAPSDELRALFAAIDALTEPGQTLGRYVGQLGAIAKDEAQARSAGVRIMTMQAAKGLTVRATIIAALEEGVIPRPTAHLSEERRLLYVAMTRAREFLYCTWARQRRGPTARAGRAPVGMARPFSSFLRGGPVQSVDGDPYIVERWPAIRT